jgi:hypothetical protein
MAFDRATKNSPHPELVEGRTMLLQSIFSLRREYREQVEIAPDERLLLCSPSALHLSFGSNGIRYVSEFLMEDQVHRPADSGVAIKRASIVLANAHFERVARGANIIGTVGAAKYVEESTHVAVLAVRPSTSSG